MSQAFYLLNNDRNVGEIAFETLHYFLRICTEAPLQSYSFTEAVANVMTED